MNVARSREVGPLARCCRALIAVVLMVGLGQGAVWAADATPTTNGTSLMLTAGTVDTRTVTNLLDTPILAGAADTPSQCVIQLDGALTPARRAALEAEGLSLTQYLPENAFVVRLDGAQRQRLGTLGFVRWVGTYQDAWKLDPTIGARLGPFQTSERIELEQQGKLKLTVMTFADVAQDTAWQQLTAFGADVLDGHVVGGLGTFDVIIDAGQLQALASESYVQFVEEASELTQRNSTDRWIVQSNISGDTPLYDNGLTGVGQLIGIMDGRVNPDHCAFSDTNPIGPTHRKIEAYNTSTGYDYHGTHVAGTCVGDGGAFDNNRGIAYEARFVFNTYPSFTESAMLDRLMLHDSQGAHIHTNSWGDDSTTQYNGLCRAIDVFSHDYEDNLVLFAETNQSALKNPENAKNVLAVGASQDTPNQGNHCSGGVGPTADGRRKPEIYAPGCGTVSSTGSGTSCSTTSLTGTSMACPAVAGTALLVRQYYTDGYYPTGAANAPDAFIPSGALIKATLLNSAVDMTGISGYPSNLEGWGRVLADNALYFPGDTRTQVVYDVRNANGLSTSDDEQYTFAVMGSSEPLHVTMVFTDAPGTSGAANPVVNNLDLTVIAPDGSTVYRGNYFSGGASIAGGTADAINNVEQILLNAPQTGFYTAHVIGTAVNQGPQGYALVITGEVQQQLPALSISLPNGVADLVAPGMPYTFDVEILPGAENVVPGSETLHYRSDGGVYESVVLTDMGGGLYEATLPGMLCGSAPEFYVSAQSDGSTVVTNPPGAPTSVHALTVGELQMLVDNDMETAAGWTVGAQDDTATSGVWNLMDPEATAAQPEIDVSSDGTLCWVTDGNAGASDGTYDVDGGKTTLYSAVIDLSIASDPVVSYYRWYSNDAGQAPNEDVFVVDVSNDGGSNWVNVELVGPAGAGTSGGWVYHEFHLTDFVAPSAAVQFRFVVADDGSPSLIEAAVDELTVNAFVCQNPWVIGDLNCDGVVDNFDIDPFVLALTSAAHAVPFDDYDAAYPNCDASLADIDQSGDVDLFDVDPFVALLTR